MTLKVAHVVNVDMGMHHLLLNQLCAIRDAGYEVVGISSPGPHVRFIEAAGIRHIAVPISRAFDPLSDLRSLLRMYRVMRRERFDIVHTHTPKGAIVGQYAALLARVRLRLHTIHGLYFPGTMKPEERWKYVLIERVTMLFSHMNLSQNPEDVPVAIRDKICRPDRIVTLGNGIDLAALDPDSQPEEQRAATRASLGLSPEHKVVGIVARFVAEKGYLEVLRAAEIVRQREPNVRFLFIGPLEPEKRDAIDPVVISQMKLDDIVLFLGQRHDMPDLYAIMDVFTLPSHREGFPRAPMEAAAMGVPAVVTDTRGCRSTVEHGKTGFLVPVRDAEALAQDLLTLLQDDKKRRAFGEAARRKALTDFDERAIFARVIGTYEHLSAEKGLSSRMLSGHG